MLHFLQRKGKEVRPQEPIAALKTDLRALPIEEDLLVWFGHSSYLLQSGGRRVLVDPVFCSAAPLRCFNRPFKGTDIYRPDDMPDIDYLIITHDHWDHLDYLTVKALKSRIGKVICPLGVGEHFEYWSFDPAQIVESDWGEQTVLDDGFRIWCLPARHFSGRGLKPNRTLWASFLLQTPSCRIFIGGDGGYGAHFAAIGAQFPDIDLAILENGQYNEAWRYIHTLPAQLPLVAKDLNAKRYLTVHHGKYALSTHPWQEPLQNEKALARDFEVIVPKIGEIISLLDT